MNRLLLATGTLGIVVGTCVVLALAAAISIAGIWLGAGGAWGGWLLLPVSFSVLLVGMLFLLRFVDRLFQ